MANQRNRGIICIILSSLSFAFMALFLRMAGDLPSIEKSFFRNLVSAVFAFIMLVHSKERFHIRKKENLYLFILRSLAGTLGIFCNFYAVDHLLLSDASCLNKLSPFFVIVFSYFLLREKITLFQSGCVAAAFIGSLFIIKPRFCFEFPGSVSDWFSWRNVRRICLCLCQKTGSQRRKRTNDRAVLFSVFHDCLYSVYDCRFSSNQRAAACIFAFDRSGGGRRTVRNHRSIYLCAGTGDISL